MSQGESPSPSSQPDCCIRNYTMFSDLIPPMVNPCTFKKRRDDNRYYTSGDICDPTKNSNNLTSGLTYQIRDLFFDGIYDATPNVFNSPNYWEDFVRHAGIRVGNLWLSFSHAGTDMRMNFNPLIDEISICGTAYGEISFGTCFADPEGAAYCADSACTSFMNGVLYHFELNIVGGIVNYNSKATVGNSRVLNVNSGTQRGLFYPIGYPEATVHFELISMNTSHFDFLPTPYQQGINAETTLMTIVSGNGTNLGLSGFAGVAGFRTINTAEFYESDYVSELGIIGLTANKSEIMATVVMGIQGYWPFFSGVVSSTRGNGMMMFMVEHSCPSYQQACDLPSSESYSQSMSLPSNSPSDSRSRSQSSSDMPAPPQPQVTSGDHNGQMIPFYAILFGVIFTFIVYYSSN